MFQDIYLVLSSIVLITLILIFVYLYCQYKLKLKSVSYTLLNPIFCGKNFCTTKIINLPFPVFGKDYNTNYNIDVAKYCAYLILRIEYSSVKNKPIASPTDLHMVTSLEGLVNTPHIGAIWSSDINSQKIIWISFRGTLKLAEWYQNFTYYQVPNFYNTKDKNPGLVHDGFLNIYNKFSKIILDNLGDPTIPIIISGHSLGSALSTLCGVELSKKGYTVSIYNFASPKVGDDDFVNTTIDIPIYQHINQCDIIPTVPPAVSPNFLDYDKPYFYKQCGKFLEFNTNRKSLLNNHLLGVYIEALNNKQS